MNSKIEQWRDLLILVRGTNRPTSSIVIEYALEKACDYIEEVTALYESAKDMYNIEAHRWINERKRANELEMQKTDAQRDYEGMLHFQAEFIKADRKLRAILNLVDEQAEDEALWIIPLNCMATKPELYLRQELRRLHALIEEGR